MKKVFNCILSLCSTVLLFNACENELSGSKDKLVSNEEVVFSSTIRETRTTGNSWDKGDAIGIYALNSETTIPKSIFDEKANIKYITKDGDGKFTASSTKIYFPDEGSLDFISYYPYQEYIKDNIYNIDISNQEKLGDIDLLFSDNSKNITNDKPQVDLQFNHMLSMVTLDIVAGDNVSSLEGIKTEIKDVTTKGTFNISDKSIELEEDSKSSIIPKVNTEEDYSSAKATLILIPGQNMSNTITHITIGNNIIKWKPNSKILGSGKHYVYKIKLSYTEAIEIESSVINEWEIEYQEDEEIITTPGDGKDEDNDDKDDETDTGSELLFIGSDFNNTEEYEESKIMDEDLTYYDLNSFKPNLGLNNTQALHIKGKILSSISGYPYILLCSVEEEKLLLPYTDISFYLKGKSNKGITVCLTNIKPGSSNSRTFFNIDNTTINNTIEPNSDKKHETGFEEGIDTNEEWKKVTLNTSKLPDIFREPRNAFGIYIQKYTEYDLLIDDIRVK